MAVAVIADAHLGGPGGAPGPLVEQLDALSPPECEHLLLLGDLFHVWVGQRRLETPEVREIVHALERVRERGVRIDYVEGNRDFFLKGSSYEGLFDSLGTEVAFSVSGRRYLAVHGDGLNDRDYLYRFWRYLSKNRASRLASLLVPGFLARRLIHGTERRLARTNFKHKHEIPQQTILAYASRRLAEGHDVLILGHFHEPRRWVVAEGEVRLLAAWFRTGEIEWLAPDNGAADGEASNR